MTLPDSNLAKALPMVRRALKVLSDREVSPQLGLLKSTLLQLDSTFSERDYGASTFRDFIEKMAALGYVKLKQVDRSLLVELKDQEVHPPAEEQQPSEPAQPVVETQPHAAYHAPAQGPSPSQIEEGVRIDSGGFSESQNRAALADVSAQCEAVHQKRGPHFRRAQIRIRKFPRSRASRAEGRCVTSRKESAGDPARLPRQFDPAAAAARTADHY